MPRARSTRMYRQTAATLQNEDGSGCFSVFTMVPLSVIFVTVFLALLAWKTPTYAYYPTSSSSTSPTSIPSTTVIPATVPTSIPFALVEVISEPVTESTKISPIFSAEVQYWSDSIVRWTSASGVDPNLAATIMQIESCGDPQATSSAGAMGLFQVMPFHFAKNDSPYDPDTNALRGINYLVRSLAASNGNARLAMAGYNGGIGVINRGEWTWSAQTKRYVQYGAPIYQDAISGYTSSIALNEWYTKYGASLCRQAHQRLGLP